VIFVAISRSQIRKKTKDLVAFAFWLFIDSKTYAHCRYTRQPIRFHPHASMTFLLSLSGVVFFFSFIGWFVDFRN
jgi:hypothetical protein